MKVCDPPPPLPSTGIAYMAMDGCRSAEWESEVGNGVLKSTLEEFVTCDCVGQFGGKLSQMLSGWPIMANRT